MKKIVLLGDSIRMGYDKYVKEALSDTAEVFYPKDNCTFAQNTLRFLHEWKKKGEWGDDVDLVHWNNGLWDIAEIYGDEPLSSIEHYTDMIRRIDRRIRLLFPKAKVVFATSTPINQAEYESQRHRFWRSNETIRRYNAVAVKVVKQYGFAVNDLYSLMEGVPDHFFSDRTHYYTKDATERMTNRVLEVIKEQLGIAGKPLDYAGLFGPSSSDVGM